MFKNIRASENGAASVEFALLIPILLLIIFGLIDFARMGFVQVSLLSASNEAVRLSVLYPTGAVPTGAITNIVTASAPGAARVATLSNTSQLTIQPVACSSTLRDENTSVTVSTTFNWLLPVELLSFFSSSPGLTAFTIRATGVARCLN